MLFLFEKGKHVIWPCHNVKLKVTQIFSTHTPTHKAEITNMFGSGQPNFFQFGISDISILKNVQFYKIIQWSPNNIILTYRFVYSSLMKYPEFR